MLDYKCSIFLLIGIILLSCQFDNKKDVDSINETTEEVENTDLSSWVYIFDGSTLEGWRGFNMDTVSANWTIDEEGNLKCLGTGGDIGGDIIYGGQQYENFELELEWKISDGANSGIFYHVVEDPKYKAPYETGPEYQIIDDIGFVSDTPLEEWQKCGADYAMYYETDKIIKKAGTWNSSKIKFTPEQATYWLNGKISAQFAPYSEEWMTKRNSGKWDAFPDYAISKNGYIGLQDHGSEIYFRNIRIRTL